MRTSLSFDKRTSTYTCDLGYVQYNLTRREAETMLGLWVLDRDCSIFFTEDKQRKLWVVEQEGGE